MLALTHCVRPQLPLPLAHAYCRRLFSRLCCLMLGVAAVHHASEEHDADASDVAGLR